MPTTRLTLSVLAILGVATIAAQEPVADFRGLAWGTPLEEATLDGKKVDLQYYTTINNENYYYLPDDELEIGTAELQQIFYVFDEHKRFFKVVIDGKPESNEEMSFILAKRFGSPTTIRRRETKFISGWEIGSVDVLLTEWRSEDYLLQIESVADDRYENEVNSEIDDF